MSETYRYNPPHLEGKTPEERAREMEAHFPDTKFIPWETSTVERSLAESTGMKAILYPRAIMDYENITPAGREGMIPSIQRAFSSQWNRAIGHVTFTTIKFVSGLPFDEVFAACLHAYINCDDWLIVRFGMNLHQDRFYYTHLNRFITRTEASEPRWQTPQMKRRPPIL